MTTYIDSHIINLTASSATTINETLMSDANFEFRGLLQDDPAIIQRQISVISAQIPVSFYNINEYNNLFEGAIGATNFTITITGGNYNGNSLCTFLNAYMSSTLAHPDITFQIDKTTGRLLWIYLNPTNDPLKTLTFRKESTCQQLFGFKTGIDYSSIQIVGNYALLQSVYPINLLGPKVLSIKSPSLDTKNFSSIYKGANTVLATIPVDAQLFGQIDYHNYSNLKTSFNNTDLNSLEIQIFDENNNLVDFNGVSWSITLAIHLTKTYNIPPPRTFFGATSNQPSISDTPPIVEPPKKKQLSEDDQLLFS